MGYECYAKHHLKFWKNQADNLAYIGFRRRFFPVFYWCLVLYSQNTVGDGFPVPRRKAFPDEFVIISVTQLPQGISQ